MEDYTLILNVISNVGFPIALAVYLLHRFEKKLDTLVEHIHKLTVTIEKQLNKE